jgi:hypothetical protein
MGWITMHRDKGQSNDEFFRAEFPNTLGRDGEILASSTIKGVYYAAVRTHETGQVWAFIALTSRAPRSHHNFGYKDQDETMGIGDYDAPAKVLDLLTETDNEYALEWRAACRKRAATKAALPKLKTGDRIRLPRGATFIVGGARVDAFEFEFCHHSTFRAHVEGHSFLVRLPNWKTSGVELVTA